MSSHTHDHVHAAAVQLEASAHAILVRGFSQLLAMTEGLAFRPLVSEKHPLPLAHVAYPHVPDPEVLRQELSQAMDADPVAALPTALALLELYECNQPDIEDFVMPDMPFIRACFNSKRCNGWIAMMGDSDRAALEAAK